MIFEKRSGMTRSVAGTLGVIRTRDPLLRKQVLYPLSYEGVLVSL